MDKRVIFAVAGSGKTTYLVESLSLEKRSLILTYTEANYENLSRKILAKFGGIWPSNITLMTYFKFLYNFCYKPYFADRIKAKGITYKSNPNFKIPQNKLDYYLSSSKMFYSNRLAFFFEKANAIPSIQCRLKKYYDELIIDEIQDIGGRDFDFIENIMETSIDMLFVGDFYQHTYDTSHDGKKNISLFDDKEKYVAKFVAKGFSCDTSTLNCSWRCSKSICQFVTDHLGISISSNRTDEDNSTIEFISEKDQIEKLIEDDSIIKLHYQEASRYGYMHKNWGEVKGEDKYNDVCVLLNKKTAKLFETAQLSKLPPTTKNKLYVAITRAKGNVYMIYE